MHVPRYIHFNDGSGVEHGEARQALHLGRRLLALGNFLDHDAQAGDSTIGIGERSASCSNQLRLTLCWAGVSLDDLNVEPWLSGFENAPHLRFYRLGQLGHQIVDAFAYMCLGRGFR